MADVFRPMVNGRRSTFYYGKLRNPVDKKWRKISLGVTDKGVAREKLRKLQTRTEQAALGMLDPLTDVPLLEHLDKFDRHLAQQDCDENYRLQTFREIVKVALYCVGEQVPKRIERKGIKELRPKLDKISLSEITPEKVDEFLATLPNHLAARTRNAYRTSVISLFSFLVKKKRLPYNPILTVTRHAGEKKRKRRALLPEQLQQLLDAAKARPLANTMLAVQRWSR
jgi:integrase